ncbi:MAG: BTAD domain-containing putative transcriptional regulator, partial [Ilumatobacteraceae bacterium]
MRFGLLGTLYVESPDGVMVTLRGHLLRTLTALFVTRNGSVVTTDEIIDTLWRDGGSSINALHAQISKLRRTLSTSDDVHPLRTVDGGYVLEVVPDDIDVVRFERLARDGAAALLAGDHDAAVTALDDALGLWRGPALGEFTAADFAVLERHRLDELRAIAREHRIDALLVSRRHELVVPELEEAVTAEPLRERLWAQLMLALYRSGRQADALRAYNRARRALVEEVGVEPGAPLRDLEQRILTQDPGLELDTPTQPVRASVAGVSVAPTYVGNVKHELSSFVGRAAELATLRELVATRRLVSIVGPGGVGKTRLASELAGPREAAWNSGAWMLALDAVSGRDGVARALLTVFGGHADGASAAVDLRAAVTVAAAEIGDAAVLVVLDNCEHVLDDARTAVSELLARCPNLRILTTSRVVLDVTGETVRQLEPLPIEDAVALFVDRGVDAQQDLDVSTDDRAVRSICEHVDRLPLGIELAAARLRVFTPRQLDAQLADRLGSISATGSSRDARHRTLPATVGWSYDLLFGPEQAVLRALSVFRGTFALDAVEAVVVDEDITAPDVADILARLVDKSLVVAERGEREPRYRLLRTVSDFAAAAADAVGETAGLCRRHAEWVAQLAARGRNGLHGPDQATWVARLRDDLPNIETALSYARHRGDVDTGLRTCADLGWFALTTTWLPSALDDLLTLLGREGEPSAAGARALAWAAVLGAGLAEAPTMAAEAVGRARSLGDDHLLAETLIVTGMPMSRRLDTADQAVAQAREGRAAAAHAADAWLVAASFALEGGARALDSGGLGDAVDLLEQAGRGYA